MFVRGHFRNIHTYSRRGRQRPRLSNYLLRFLPTTILAYFFCFIHSPYIINACSSVYDTLDLNIFSSFWKSQPIWSKNVRRGTLPTIPFILAIGTCFVIFLSFIRYMPKPYQLSLRLFQELLIWFCKLFHW